MDKIVYVSKSIAGGVDGLDRSDKGGVIYGASFEKGRLKDGPGSKVEAMVINIDEAKRSAIEKLNAVDRLVLGL